VHFEDSPQEAAFRAQAKAWLEAHAPRRAKGDEPIGVFSAFLSDDEADLVERARAWQATLVEGGFAGLMWPREYGGRGVGPLELLVFAEEVEAFDVPRGVCDLGIAMMGPTIIAHCTDQQKRRWLPSMLRGEEIWCQLWSEPGAGSDLAGLSTRADYDEAAGEFVLNGQKVWTSGAQYSEWGLGIFRSAVDRPKRRGITCLAVPMDSPGIEIRPLEQMTGGAHFNEVFFTDVRVPAANMLGELHDGWTVARTTMMNERFAASAVGSPTAFMGPLLDLARQTTRGGRAAASDAVLRQRLADVWIRGRICELTSARVRTSLGNGMIPGMEGSILKLVVADLGSDAADLAMDILGPAATTLPSDAASRRWITAYLGAHAMHIGGGTDSIQRNIIGEQVLGLPREPSVDMDLTFRELQNTGRA